MPYGGAPAGRPFPLQSGGRNPPPFTHSPCVSPASLSSAHRAPPHLHLFMSLLGSPRGGCCVQLGKTASWWGHRGTVSEPLPSSRLSSRDPLQKILQSSPPTPTTCSGPPSSSAVALPSTSRDHQLQALTPAIVSHVALPMVIFLSILSLSHDSFFHRAPTVAGTVPEAAVTPVRTLGRQTWSLPSCKVQMSD